MTLFEKNIDPNKCYILMEGDLLVQFVFQNELVNTKLSVQVQTI